VVAAVVVGAAPAPALGALSRQTHPVAARTAPGLGDALAGAGDGRLWLLSAQAEPEPDALERLVAVAREFPEAPLLASLPVDRAGAVQEAALPRGDEAATLHLLASVAHGLVPIRRALLTSLLVDAAGARAAPAPQPERFGPLAAFAWTAGLMAARAGYLVVASRVRVPPPPGLTLSALPAVARLRREGLLTPGETVRSATSALSLRRRG
jgi:hypothetical protein